MFYFPYISADLKVSMAYTKSESEIAEFAAVQMKLQLYVYFLCRLAMFRRRPGDHCQRGWGLLVGAAA